MCYHTSIPSREKIKKRFNSVVFSEPFNELNHLSGFSFSKTPVITSEDNSKIQLFSWGLIPKWVKDEKQAIQLRNQTLNARSETIFEKPSFRSSIAKKRCLVIVNGFFEWMDFKGKKYPHFIYMKNKEPFAFGGIYENWTDRETGEIKSTYSIVTTEANPLMAIIHNSKQRMPLILPREAEDVWRNPELGKDEIIRLMTPFDEKSLGSHTISKLITSRTNPSNVPAVKEQYNYPELSSI
jgi:putative SOS response-associated peptidase YedK